MSEEEIEKIREISLIKDIRYSQETRQFTEYSIERSMVQKVLKAYDELKSTLARREAQLMLAKDALNKIAAEPDVEATQGLFASRECARNTLTALSDIEGAEAVKSVVASKNENDLWYACSPRIADKVHPFTATLIVHKRKEPDE